MKERPMVLLVGQNTKNSPHLLEWLHGKGSRCQFAQSYRDACDLIPSTQFDLVLSEYQLPDRTAFPLMDWLEGSSATLFFSTRVENGSPWLKMLDQGRRCVGAPLVRSGDLTRALATMLESAAESYETESVSAD